MDQKEIRKKIEVLQRELETFQAEKQKEIDKFMFESGLSNFINDVSVRVAKMQGRIETLQEFLDKDDIKIDEEEE
jgi:hypothetical protein